MSLTKQQIELIQQNRHGWSQRQWARQLGVSRQMVQRAMEGRIYAPSDDQPVWRKGKLSRNDIDYIRRNPKGMTDRTLAGRFNVSASTVFKVRHYLRNAEVA